MAVALLAHCSLTALLAGLAFRGVSRARPSQVCVVEAPSLWLSPPVARTDAWTSRDEKARRDEDVGSSARPDASRFVDLRVVAQLGIAVMDVGFVRSRDASTLAPSLDE